MDLRRYTALFLADGREHLRRASAELLRWERDLADLAPLAELFRAFHSLKGAAASMGYGDVVDLTHGAEHLLEAVRRGELAPSRAVVAALFRTVDLLEQGIEPATAGVPIPEADQVVAALARLVSTSSPVAAPAAAPAAAPTPMRTERRPVRVDPDRLDDLLQTAGELVVARNRLANLVAARTDPELEQVSGQVDSLVRSLHGLVIKARLAPVSELFGRFPRVVRDLGESLGKPARLELGGEGIELDRAMLEELVEPLIHLLRNAVDHGVERPADRVAAGKPAEASLRLGAGRRREWIVIRLEDDGRGVDRDAVVRRAVERGLLPAAPETLSDAEVLQLLVRPGFSTKAEVTEVSGRGVGLDVVASKVRALGGSLGLRSEPGRGTVFEITVPLTTAVQRVLLVGADGERYAIPFRLVREAVLPGRTETVAGNGSFAFRDRSVPFVDLAELVGRRRTEVPNRRPVLVLEWGSRDGAVAVDTLLGQHDVLLERIEAPDSLPGWVSGATILADGAPAFVLDPTAFF